jgi:uncharacterized protein
MNQGEKTPPGSGSSKREFPELNLELLAEVGDTCEPGICRQLLDQGADANTRDEDGCTPLLWAVLAGSYPTVELLLTRGAQVNASNQEKETALHWAATVANVEIAELLLKHGARVNVQDAYGVTPLRSAILLEDQEMIDLLRRYDAT